MGELVPLQLKFESRQALRRYISGSLNADTGGCTCDHLHPPVSDFKLPDIQALRQVCCTQALPPYCCTGRESVLCAKDTALQAHYPSMSPDPRELDRVACLQVTDRAAAALSLKADGEEVNQLRLFVKGQFADVRAAAKEGAGRGRLSYTTGAGHTLCLSCDQPLAPLRGHTHEPLAPQGVSTPPTDTHTPNLTAPSPPTFCPLSQHPISGAWDDHDLLLKDP